MTDVRKIALATYEAYGLAMQNGDFDTILPLVAEDLTFQVAYPFARFAEPLKGRDALVDTLHFARDDLADRITFERTGVVVEGTRVLIQCNETGTTDGVAYSSALAFVMDIDGDHVTGLHIYLGWVDPDAVIRAHALDPDTLRDEVLDCERSLTRSVITGRREEADKVLHENFAAIGHTGIAVNREAYLDTHFSSQRGFTLFDTHEQAVKPVGLQALVTGTVTMANAERAQNPSSALYSALYEKVDEIWMLRFWQETSASTTTS